MAKPQSRRADAPLQVPLLDLQQQYAAIRNEIEPAIKAVCDSQRFILGPRVADLEARVAAYSGARHGIGVSSGTDALLIALMALGIGPGDEVITSTFSFFATAGVIARVGARPVFCDIDEKTFNIDPRAVGAFIEAQCEIRDGSLWNRASGRRVKAMIPVHLYGQMADMDRLMELARRHRLRVVEDAAQAIGAELPDGRRAGSIGDIGCFSFFPTKNLGAFGDAGMCVTNDAVLAEQLRVLRVHGGRPKYYHSVVGGNFRLDELQAAVLLVKLAHLDAWTRGRQNNAEHYERAFADTALDDEVGTPAAVPGGRHIYNQYVIRALRRDELRAHLGERGVGTEIYYPVPLHKQPCFESFAELQPECARAERAAAETLALPIYPELSGAQLDYVVAEIEAFYRG
jgi:dTDP-4-amino-4,6-dideoxygalactose transaminase